MPKIVSIPPPIPKEDISKEGTSVTITDVHVAKDIFTQIGEVKKALALTVKIGKETYSHLFSLDKQVIAGSAGRLLASIGLTDTDNPDFEKTVKTLEGKKVTVANRGGKLYWYP